MAATTITKRSNGNFSRQPRFDTDNPDELFTTLFQLVRRTSTEEPDYKADSRERDKWIRDYIKLEPNLMGVVNNVVDIDKNRGWTMVGGRNQVRKYTRMLHEFGASPGLYGWRPAISFASTSFWTSDLGCVVELGRDGKFGPIRALYTVDSGNCYLTGDDEFPLYYEKDPTKRKRWRAADFFRAASMISTDEEMNGLGYCAVSRAIELTKLMIAVYAHDHEVLADEAATGLLLLSGIDRNQWSKAMESRDEENEGRVGDYLSNVAVLASKLPIEAKLIALSNLPQSFNFREWMDMIMFGYALCFGFDPSEFWAVNFGALGRGTETEIQHEKATGKGRLDFVLSFQEQFQEFLPESIRFEFDQRDEKGDLLHAQVNQAWTKVATELYGSQGPEGSLILRDEARMLLADSGVIPRAWAPTETAVSTDLQEEEIEEKDEIINNPPVDDLEGEQLTDQDTSRSRVRLLRESLLSDITIVRAAEQFPKEPIVMYSYPTNTEFILWRNGEDLLRQRVW